jgi:hypothetical protein
MMGTVTVDDIFGAIGRALSGQAGTGLPAEVSGTGLSGRSDRSRPANTIAAGRSLEESLGDPSVAWQERWDALGALLNETPLVLLIDNLEANLVRASDGTWVLADPQLAALLARWASGSGPGRLILTSRLPFELPDGAHRRLWDHHVGPLSWPEARTLIWRLRALDTLSLANQHRSYVDVGGHPRSLEILDALLRRPGASFTDVRQRMARLLLDRKIDRAELWMAQVGKHGVDASLAEAVTLAVHRSLLADLLATLDEPVRRLLAHVAASRRPVAQAQLFWPAGKAGLADAIAALERLHLLTRVSEDDGVSFVVDPGTADLLTSAT